MIMTLKGLQIYIKKKQMMNENAFLGPNQGKVLGERPKCLNPNRLFSEKDTLTLGYKLKLTVSSRRPLR